MHLGLDCRSACAPPSRPSSARAGARKQVQATIQAAPQAPLQVQVFLAGLDEEPPGMWQRSNAATAPTPAPTSSEPHKLNGVHRIPTPTQQTSPDISVTHEAPVQRRANPQPMVELPVPDTVTTTSNAQGSSQAEQAQAEVSPTSTMTVQASQSEVQAEQSAPPPAIRKRSWQRSSGKQRGRGSMAGASQPGGVPATQSLAEVLQQLDHWMHQHASSTQKQHAGSTEKQHTGIKGAGLAPTAPDSHKTPKHRQTLDTGKAGVHQRSQQPGSSSESVLQSKVPVSRAHTRPSVSVSQPNAPSARSSVQHLPRVSQIQALPDLRSLYATWSECRVDMPPQHTTAMWVRLNQLVQARVQSQQSLPQQQQQQQQALDHVYASGSDGAASSLAHANSASMPADSHAFNGGNRQQQQGSSGRFVGQRMQQYAQLKAVMSPQLLKVWRGLQQQSMLHVHSTSISQVADQLHAHTQLQLLLDRQLQLAQQLSQLRTTQQPRPLVVTRTTSSSTTTSSTTSSSTVVMRSSYMRGGEQEQGLAGAAAEGPLQPELTAGTATNVNSGKSSVPHPADSSNSSSTALKGLQKRARNRLVTYQLRHAKFVRDQLQLSASGLHEASPGTLTVLLACLSRLDQTPPRPWVEAWCTASLPKLKQCSAEQLSSTCQSVGHLKLQLPAAWCQSLYEATQPLLGSVPIEPLCTIVHGAAMLRVRPPASWSSVLLKVCNDRFDQLDAPAYALLLHGLGRMRLRPSTGWIQEYWDSTISIMDDFTVQELSLMLRGAAYLGCAPEPHWQQELWHHSQRLLKPATADQLVGLGWAVLVGLRLRPPRSWVTTWLAALNRKVRPAGIQGGSRLPRGVSHRAAAALTVIGVRDLVGWCGRLRVRVPARARDDTGQQSVSLGWSSDRNTMAADAGPTVSGDWDGAQWQGADKGTDFIVAEEDSAASPVDFSYGAPRPRLFQDAVIASPSDPTAFQGAAAPHAATAPSGVTVPTRPTFPAPGSVTGASPPPFPTPGSVTGPPPPPFPAPLPGLLEPATTSLRQLEPSMVPVAPAVNTAALQQQQHGSNGADSRTVVPGGQVASYNDAESSDENEQEVYNSSPRPMQVAM